MSSIILHQPPGELIPSEDTLSLMLKTSSRIAQSGLAGKNASADTVLAIALTGRELGIPFMTAVRGIHIIEGKPSPSAAMIAALIYRDHGDTALRVVESSAERCTIKYRRKGWPEGETESFTLTMKEAQQQGWHLGVKWVDGNRKEFTKDTWKKFPKAMLRSRAITIVGQDAFPDSVLGLYTPDELDAELPDLETQKVEHHMKSLGLDADLDATARHMIDPEPEPELPERQLDEELDEELEEISEGEYREVDKPGSVAYATSSEPPMTDNQGRYLHSLMRDAGLNEGELNRIVEEKYGKAIEYLVKSEASSLIGALQQVVEAVKNAGFDGEQPGLRQLLGLPQVKPVPSMAIKDDEKAQKKAVAQAAIDEVMSREGYVPQTGEILTWDEAMRKLGQTRIPQEAVETFSVLLAMAQTDEETELAITECRATFIQLLEGARTRAEMDQVTAALNEPEVKEAGIKNKALGIAYRHRIAKINELEERAEAQAKAEGVPF